MSERTKIYFASDFHLGVPSYEESLQREKLVVQWLDLAARDAKEIYLVGDIFDFWFEHKYTVPKGYVRLLGKIAALTDAGITINVFTGNHDMWMYDYLPHETGVKLFTKPIVREYGGKKFYIGHGDGLGPGDRKYKFFKIFFHSKVCQWLFARFHPNFSIGLGNWCSRVSGKSSRKKDKVFLGEDKEWLFVYCQEVLQQQHIDYFIFGHRHLPLDLKPAANSRYINLGEWMNHRTYAVFDGKELEFKKFE